MEDKDFINREFPQNCGDSLFVIEKTNIKNKNNHYLFRCYFKKYFYEVLKTKDEILKGKVSNPLIEENEFIGCIFPQNCGDSLKVLKKTEQKIGGNFLYECEFQKYYYKCLALKGNILKRKINNPEIENQTFIGKIFQQNCGDSLKVIKKIFNSNINNTLYECEFQKYPCKVLASKTDILRGKVRNLKEDEYNFVNYNFLQNCGDILKVLKKTDNKNSGGYWLYECEFIKYPYKCLCSKQEVLKGKILNQNLPWMHKESLKEYIQLYFKDNKVTLSDLSKSLNIAISTIGQKINEFGLREYISYSLDGLENQIKDYIESLNVDVIKNYWVKEIQKEIDIYIPSKKLGIEVNGNYWHSSLYKKQNYHQEKSILVQGQNINLIHIFEYEWNDLRQQEILKSLIKSKLGIFDICFGARHCKVKELDYKTYADFCNKNHLQGECGAKVKLGLYYFDELIQVMSFGAPRFTDKYEWEIIRECSKLGYITIGGKEKLWKYFINKYNPSSVISYCDFSKFEGKSYLKLNFKKIGLNKSGFVWVSERFDETFWRNPYKHKEMKEAGYNKIYDCGQLVFVWRN